MKPKVFFFIFILFFTASEGFSSFCDKRVAMLSVGQDAKKDAAMVSLATTYLREYKIAKIPEFEYDYKENLKNLDAVGEIGRQLDFFRKYESGLGDIDRRLLSQEAQYLYEQIKFEIEFNLERLSLEASLRQRFPSEIPAFIDGLFQLPDHEKWYRLYLKKTASRNITPEEVFELGQNEVIKVTSEIKKIQKLLGFENRDEEFRRHLESASFIINSEDEIVNRYKNIGILVSGHLAAVVGESHVPPFQIEAAPNPTKDTPPAYYDKGVFYFNFFNGQYNSRGLDFVFLHEAVPGHHYQITLSVKSLVSPEFTETFWYPGFVEGWGAYVEDIGKDLGLYTDIYSELGKWEWDLVRSARLVIDVGIHSKGWSKTQSLEYWKKNVPGQDGIAVREVDRITRWPGQVVSYKVGEKKILDLKNRVKNSQGSNFDQKRFHSLLLFYGALPLDILNLLVEDAYKLH